MVAGLGSWALLEDRRAELRESFDLDARVLHRVLSQRMEQQETVLNAVESLAAQGVERRTLGGYVKALIRPYPQITAVEQCTSAGCEALTPLPGTLPVLPFTPGGSSRVRWPAGTGTRYALERGRIRVWVEARALLPGADLPPEPMTVRIYRPESRSVLAQREGGAVQRR